MVWSIEQRWADLIPGLFEPLGLWRDPGVNVGYWRAAISSFERASDRVLVDGQPLRCFHFTGFEPERPERLSRYDNRISLDREPVLAELCAGSSPERLDCMRPCRDQQLALRVRQPPRAGHRSLAVLRQLWDRAAREGTVRETPFTSEGEHAFLRWLAEPEPAASRGSLSRYLSALHEADPKLRECFPDPHGADQERYITWAEEQAERRPNDMFGLLRAGAHAATRPGLRELSPGETLDAGRGEVVVCDSGLRRT